MKFVLLVCLLLWQGSAYAQMLGSKYTYPQPPKFKPEPQRIFPSMEIPQNPDSFKWRLTRKIDGRDLKAPEPGVKVFQLAAGRLVKLGTLPEGTEIKLDSFRRAGRLLFWQIPWKDGKKGWVNGQNIELVAAP